METLSGLPAIALLKVPTTFDEALTRFIAALKETPTRFKPKGLFTNRSIEVVPYKFMKDGVLNQDYIYIRVRNIDSLGISDANEDVIHSFIDTKDGTVYDPSTNDRLKNPSPRDPIGNIFHNNYHKLV